MNSQERTLVADCLRAGLNQIPKSLPKDTDWLILSGNNITSLQILDLQFFHDLSRLDLHNNKIKYISKEFVEYLSTHQILENLDISNNNLTTLPRIFQNISSLKRLKLSKNPLQCNCENMWMKDWLNSSAIIEDSLNIICTLPSGEEIQLIDMNPEDMNCPLLDKMANLWKILGLFYLICLSLMSYFQHIVGIKNTYLISCFSAILILVLLIPIIILCRKWEAIKFWMFIQFGFKFKDKDEKMENLKDMDYDAFVNYA